VTFWTFEDRGFLTAKKIDELSINVKNSDIFLCGPPAMMQSLRKQFIEIGIKNKNIHSEEFQL
jgi:predicted ferric reductase